MKKLSLFFFLIIFGFISCNKEEASRPEESTQIGSNDPEKRVVYDKSVRFIYFIPRGTAYDPAREEAIKQAALTVQAWYAEHFGGRTFRLNSPIVERFDGNNTESWYETNPIGNDNSTFWTLRNTWREVSERWKIGDLNPNYKTVIYTSSRGGTAAVSGAAIMPREEMDGVRDIIDAGGIGIRNAFMALAHEIGHTFILDDTGDANSIMGDPGYFTWPNANFTSFEYNKINNSGFINTNYPLPFNSTTNYKITNLASGLQVAIAGNSLANGANLVTYTANTGLNQRFRMIRVGNNRYRIVGVSSNKAWDIFGGYTDDDTEVIQWDNSQSENRTFNLVKYKGRWMLYSANSHKAVVPFQESNAIENKLVQANGRLRNSYMWTIN